MQHVDEGVLHAYLDGALDEFPAAEAQKVREHLEVCSACRERLEVERVLRDQAASILGASAPDVVLPSFEELRGRAQAGVASRRPSPVLRRIGWAASVVLALGAGWLLRGDASGPTTVGDASSAGPLGERGASVAESTTTPASGISALAAGGGGDAAESNPALSDSPVRLDQGGLLPSRTEPVGSVVDVAERGVGAPPVGLTQEELAPEVVPEVVVDLGATAPPLPEAPPIDAPTAVGVVDSDIASSRAGLVGSPDRVLTVEQVMDAPDRADGDEPEPGLERRNGGTPEVATSANVSAPPAGISPLGRTSGTGDTGDTGRDDAGADEEPYSLVVPGLDVLDVRYRGTGVRPEGQVVLQRLEGGDTLQIIHLPKEIDISELGRPAADEQQLTVSTQSGWIVMRAPVREEELVELVRRLLDSH